MHDELLDFIGVDYAIDDRNAEELILTPPGAGHRHSQARDMLHNLAVAGGRFRTTPPRNGRRRWWSRCLRGLTRPGHRNARDSAIG